MISGWTLYRRNKALCSGWERIIKCFFLSLLMVALFSGLSACLGLTSHAQTRDLYIGDSITIDIDTNALSKEEILVTFSDFEIISLESKEIGYSLSIRSKSPGMYSVYLGNTLVEIEVKSTLDSIERDDIFEGDLSLPKEKSPLILMILCITSSIVFLSALVLLLIRKLRQKKEIIESVYDVFESSINDIDTRDDRCLGQLSLCLKRYLDQRIGSHTTSALTDEVIESVSKVTYLKEHMDGLSRWLKQCDSLKYQPKNRPLIHTNRGRENSDEGYETMRVELRAIVARLEKTILQIEKMEEDEKV